jgi:hypothetical protein
MRKSLWIVNILFGFSVATLSAQATDNDKSKFGLIFSGTWDAPSVGAIWQPSDHLAFSPHFNFRHEWKGTPYGSNTLSVGAKLPLYLKNWGNMRLYVAPGYEFTRIRTQAINYSTNTDNKSISNEGSGVWGIQYALGNRISIFGDMGVAYQDRCDSFISIGPPLDSRITTFSTRTRTYSVGLKNSIGIIFYLK